MTPFRIEELTNTLFSLIPARDKIEIQAKAALHLLTAQVLLDLTSIADSLRSIAKSQQQIANPLYQLDADGKIVRVGPTDVAHTP